MTDSVADLWFDAQLLAREVIDEFGEFALPVGHQDETHEDCLIRAAQRLRAAEWLVSRGVRLGDAAPTVDVGGRAGEVPSKGGGPSSAKGLSGANPGDAVAWPQMVTGALDETRNSATADSAPRPSRVSAGTPSEAAIQAAQEQVRRELSDWLPREMVGRIVQAAYAVDGVGAPPAAGPWKAAPWTPNPKSPMASWWRVFRGGMRVGSQPSGAFESEAEALAVRDALNRIAG